MHDEIGDFRPVSGRDLVLVDRIAGRVETGRQGLDQRACPARRIGLEQARRIEETAHVVIEPVVEIAGGGDIDR